MTSWKPGRAAALKTLLDSHVFVWFLTGDPRCSARVRDVIERSGSHTHVSAVTAWELSTKVRIGKWPEAEAIAANISAEVAAFDLTALPITIEHGRRAGSFPAGHKDPFDRILAAQAQVEDLVLVTADPAFRQFDVRILW